MKISKHILLFFLGLFFMMCKKEDDGLYWGEAGAVLNGEAWDADPYGLIALVYPEGFIGINTEVSNIGFVETLSFGRVPTIPGEYPLGVTVYPPDSTYVGAFFGTLIGGDILGDFYILDTLASDNYFEVLSYKEGKKEIEVKFTATFLLDNKVRPDAPDTLRFEDGYIKTRVHVHN